EPFSAYSTKSARKRVNKTHYYNKHSASLNGGQFCWDCHDAHGDRTGTNNGPIAMIQKRPVKASVSDTGVPSAFTDATSVRFIARAAVTDFGRTTAPFNTICNVCHDQKSTDPNKMVHYTATGSDGSHNTATICTQCHQHNADNAYDGMAYRGAGGNCNSCHGANNAGLLSADTTAGHAIHYNRTSVFRHYTGSNRHLANAYAFACKNCHGKTIANHENSGNLADISISGGTYTFGSYSARDGRGFKYSTAGTCSQNSCHWSGNSLDPAPVTATVTWTSAKTTNCGSCHNQASDSSFKWSGAHTKHVRTTTLAVLTCNVCHSSVAGSSSSIIDQTRHVNGFVNVSGNVAAGTLNW
ncbi:CxxxxCH/CxxCH domain-containing protein, partial [Geobacter sp. OR-1]|uniref:CxxxxCH/CxxCH domain c-type cytochrome n=1 Tax=Geobacter sp. OR-1 TaxID=1266765 RepID=UPI001269D8E2